MSDGPTYTREEMNAILERALTRQQARSEGIGHDELVDAAEEAGIPRAEVEEAARELHRGRSVPPGVDERRARAVRKLTGGVATWLVFSVFFYLLCLKTGGDWWWWAVVPWGLGLALNGIQVFLGKDYGSGSRGGRRARRREEKRREFDARVQSGADAILRVLDRAKEQGAARVRMKVDFEPMTPTRVQPTPIPPRARIEPADDEAPATEAPAKHRAD